MSKKILLKFVIILGVASFVTQSYAQSGPPVLTLNAGDDLISELASHKNDLEDFFDDIGKDYTIGIGVGPLTINDPNNSQYINSIRTGYARAVQNAYADIARQLGSELVTTSTSTDIKETQGNLGEYQLNAACQEQAKAYFKQKEDDENSMLSVIKQGIRDLTSNDDEDEAEQKPVDKTYDCNSTKNMAAISETISKSISDAIRGGRILTSAMHEGEIGIVVAVSKETYEVASILENQYRPAQYNPKAKKEIRDWIKSQVENYPNIPHGLVGTRMKKLSNGEWAIIAFGAAQVNNAGSNSGGLLGKVSKQNASGLAADRASAELARFSQMSVDFNRDSTTSTKAREQVKKTVNLTQDSTRTKNVIDEAIGAVIEESFDTDASLELKGADRVFSKKYDDGGLSFYLHATGWSPSMMTKNSDRRQGYERAADNAGQIQSESDAPSSGGGSSVITFEEDW